MSLISFWCPQDGNQILKNFKFQVSSFKFQVQKTKQKSTKTSQYFKFICKYLISNSFLTKVSSSEFRPPTPSGFNTPPASERPVVYSFNNSSLSDISEYYPPEKNWKESQFEPSVSSPSVDTAQCIQSQNLYTSINSEEVYIQVSIPELELPPSSSQSYSKTLHPKYKSKSDLSSNSLVLKQRKQFQPTNYKAVSKDLAYIKKVSIHNSYFTKRYSNILRNQLVRAHSHSLLELALQFERFRQRNPHNKDPT